MKKNTKIILGFSTVLTLAFGLSAVSCEGPIVTKTEIKNDLKYSEEIKQANLAANKVVLSVENSKNILAADVKKSMIKVNNLDEKKYKINIGTIYKNNDHTSLIVEFGIQTIVDNIKSENRFSIINGFKKIPLTLEQLNQETKLVKFDVQNIDSTPINAVDKKSLKIEGIDLTKFNVNIESVSKDPNNNSMLINFKIIDRDDNQKSDLKSFTLKGFKRPAVLKETLNKLAEGSTFDYFKKEDVLAINANTKDIIDPILNNPNVKVEVTNLVKNSDNSITITYKLVDKLYEDNFSNSFTTKINGFKIPEITMQKLNEENAKLSFEYPNVSQTLITNIDKNKVEIKNIDSDRISVIINNISPNKNKTSVNVTYTIFDNKYPTDIINNQTKTISGFKIPTLTDTELNSIFNSISLKYEGEDKIFPTEANSKGVTITNPNSSTTTSIISVKPDVVNIQSVLVKVKLTDKNYPEKFIEKDIKIDGFKHPAFTAAQLDKYAENIVVDYPLKSEIWPADIDNNEILFKSYPKDFVNVNIESVDKSNENKTISVKFILKDLNSENKSSEITKVVKGFKTFQISTQELVKEGQNVTFSYDNKNTVLTSAVDKTKIKGSGNDNSKTKIEVRDFQANTNNDGIIITFRVVDNNYENNFYQGIFELKGFKKPDIMVAKLNTFAENLSVDYPLKSEILAGDADKNKVQFSSYPANNTKVNIVSISENTDKKSITVKYTLSDLSSKNKSEEKTKIISGFKTYPLTVQQLNVESKKVNFTYAGKENTLASAVTKDKIIGNGFENSKVKLSVVSFASNPQKDGIIITYKVTDSNYDGNYFENTSELKGFKEPKLSDQILESLKDSVKLVYINEQNTLAANAKKTDVTFEGVSSKLKVEVKSIAPVTGSPRSVTIAYKVMDKNYPDNSITIIKELDNFKALPLKKDELNKLLKDVFLVIRNPQTKTVDELTNSDYVLLGLDSSKFAIDVKSTKILSRTSVEIKYALKEKGGNVDSDESTHIFTGLKFSLPTKEAFTRPAKGIFERSVPVNNSEYDVSIASSIPAFDYKSEGANSYRIPGLIKLKNGDVIANADKRINNASDSHGGPIEQVIRRSTDNGNTWSPQIPVIKIEAPRLNDGLTIDGTMAEVLVDKNNPAKGYKLLYMVDLFTGFNGIGNLLKGNPFVKVGNESLWKVWERTNGGGFSQTQYVFRKVTTKPGWWRLYRVPEGQTRDTISNLESLAAEDTYLDMTYDSENRSISGQIYENVAESDLLNPALLKTRATKYSIFDSNSDSGSKYAVAVNNYNLMIESFDNGKTWSNPNVTDATWNIGPDESPFKGSAVGDGIQLEHQKDKSLNGRIIFPLYNDKSGSEHSFYIYSDDNGKTWTRKDISNFPNQNSESSMVELSNGDIYWLFRDHGEGNSRISKSTDGGKTWHSPVASDAASSSVHTLVSDTLDGNVFTGMTSFNIKGQDYFVFSAPDNVGVKNRSKGAIYITKDWQTLTKVWTFDTDSSRNAQHFGYSYPMTVEVGKNYADIVVAYEWNKNIPSNANGSAITIDKFRIIPKK